MKTLLIDSKRGSRIVFVDDDFDKHDWNIRLLFNHTREYAVASKVVSGKRHQAYLHHLVVGRPEKGLCVDHIDGNGLNNQRSNLRFVDHSTNMRNRPGIRGYRFRKDVGMYEARIVVMNKEKHIGMFLTPDEARAAYLAELVKLDPMNINLVEER